MTVGWLVENAAPFVYEEVAALRKRGIAVSVASVFRPWGAQDWNEAFDGPVYYPERGRHGWLMRSIQNAARRPGVFARLMNCARRERAPYRLVALAADLAERAKIEGWTHVHGTFATFPAWVAWAVAEMRSIPFSMTGHAYDVQEPRPWLPRVIDDCAFARAISSETAERMKRLAASGSGRSKIRVAHLGVDTECFAPSGDRRRRGVSRVLCVANHVPEKGIAHLLEATRQLMEVGTEARIELVGEGPLTESLRAHATRLGLTPGPVLFRGHCDREQVRRALARATVFALPCSAGEGVDHDGLPVAILEAMACGLPVVTTPVGGIPDAIEDGQNGCLVPPDDPDALARVLSELLRDPEKRRRLGARARRSAEERFSASAAARRLDVLLADTAPGVRA